MTDTPEAVRLAELLSADPTESPVSLAAAALLRRIPELKSERDQLRAELKTAVAERDQLLSWQQAAFRAHPNIDLDIEAASLQSTTQEGDK